VIAFLCNESKDKTSAPNAKGKNPTIAEKIFAAEVLLDAFANPETIRNGTRSGAITLTELFFQPSSDEAKEQEKEKINGTKKESKKKQEKKKEKGNGKSTPRSGRKRGVPDAANVTNLLPSTGYTDAIPIMSWFINSISQETAEALQIHDVSVLCFLFI